MKETAEEKAEAKQHMENFTKARGAIVANLGGPWKKGKPFASGQIDCPVCGAGKLHYRRSDYNGHIHARCSTAGCMSWME